MTESRLRGIVGLIVVISHLITIVLLIALALIGQRFTFGCVFR
jgi:hypothetical protein